MTTHSEPNSGFRVTSDHLSDEDAYQAMRDAASTVLRAALQTRSELLNLGFSSVHSLCKELDETARQYAIVFEALRRQEHG